MIRFVEMSGIYLDETKSFGFYDTVTDKFIQIGESITFDSYSDFVEEFDSTVRTDFNRFNSLIPERWR